MTVSLFPFILFHLVSLFATAESVLARSSVTTRIPIKKLTPGATLEATIDNPVYLGSSELLPAATRLRFTLASVTKERPRISTLRRIGALATGGPLPKATYKLTPRAVSLLTPDGTERPIDAEIVTLSEQRRLRAKGQSIASAPQQRDHLSLVVRLSGFPSVPAGPIFATTAEIPSGAKARILLLKGLRASNAKAGDPIEAQLLEPIRLNGGATVPAGTLLTGAVTASKGPRRVFRPASLRLGFNSLRLPDGRSLPIATVLSSANTEKGAGASLDAEGGLSGGPVSKLRLAVDIGLAYASGKLIDDIFEEGVKAGVGTAAAGSAATTARYIGLGTGAVFLLLQRGNDVSLPQYTELELTFARPLMMSGSTAGAVPLDPRR
ncbi:MAG: hypothetical protein JST93_22995 [Acidobacteria bacterium]|nr:hypothetical protein [Acidobacteriota bacterium]